MKNKFSSIQIVLVLTVLISGFTFGTLKSNADSKFKYNAHTNKKEADHLKTRAVRWNGEHVVSKKQYYTEYAAAHHSADREEAFLKRNALRWHLGHVEGKKQYYTEYAAAKHSADNEVANKKEKALTWHRRSSWE